MPVKSSKHRAEAPAREVQGANLLFKAVRVLDAVADAAAAPRLADIAATTGLPVGTAHRILEALATERLVRRDEGSRTYRLGPRLLQMARHSLDGFDLRAAAEAELERLHAALGETVVLAVLTDGAVVIIDRREGRQPLRPGPVIGEQVQLHCTALGKAVLSALEPVEQRRILAALALPARTEATVTDRDTLKGHLEMLGTRGYAIDDEESAPGIRAVAAAILDQRGHPIGALGLIAPAAALPLERSVEIGRTLGDAALAVAWTLGINPPERWSHHALLPRTGDAVTRAVAGAASIGASPVWHPQSRQLYWLDITRAELRCSRPEAEETRVLPLPALPGNVVPARDGLLIGLPSGIHRLDPERGRLEPLLDLIGPGRHQRYNAARCDRRGRLWITTMDVTVSRPAGRLWRVEPDLDADCIADGLLVPIGIAWSPDDRRLYHCDAPRREIYVWDFDLATGRAVNRRVFARLAEGAGRPTGLAVDRDGFVWNTQTDGWSLVRYDPDGRVERVIALPVPKPIDCSFGGPEHRTLFITTARVGLPERRLADVPWSGSVLAHDCPVPGLPVHAFGAPGA